MNYLRLAISVVFVFAGSAAYADCVDDLEGIDNSSSVDGEPLEGGAARTPKDFASAALSRLYAGDENDTIGKIKNENSWAIIRAEDAWADIAMSSVTQNTLPPQAGSFYNNNFAVCADNGQCAQIDFQINFVREDNISGNFVNYFMSGMLQDMSQNGAWDSTVTIGMPHTYIYNINSYTVNVDLAGDIHTETVDSTVLTETIETLGGLFVPSSYGTYEEQAAMEDKTCRDNEGNAVDSNGNPLGGSGGGGIDPYDEPWEGYPEEIQERCWWINTEQGYWTNC